MEDRSNLDKLTKHKLYGILIAYEMRIKPENIYRKEATFKSTRKLKTINNKSKSIEYMSDEEEANFQKKVKRRTRKIQREFSLQVF